MSFFLYAAGILSLFASDILVTRFLGADEIALWAESRALIGIVGVVAAGGLDLVFIRTPASSARLLVLAVVQIPVAALLLGAVIHSLGYLSSYAVAVALTAGSAFIFVLARYFGANQRMLISQLIQQGWKIVALCLVMVGGAGLELPGSDFMLSGALMLFVLIGAVFVLRMPPSTLCHQDPDTTGSLYGIAVRFMATSLILALAVYGEQLIVNGLSTTADAAIFFTHATYFLFPVSVLNGYLAFRIGPWLRDNHDRFCDGIIGRPALILLAAFSYTLVAHVAGWLGWLIIAPATGQPDPLLQVPFFVSAFSRTLYTLPSGYNGIFGSPRQHDLLIVSQTVLLLAIAATVGALNGRLPVVYLVALAGTANWVLRTAVSYGVTKAIIASTRE